MNIKKALLNNYYINQDILYILPHSISRYFNLVYRYVFALFFLYILYFIFWSYVDGLNLRFGLIGVFFYMAFVYSFGDIYLDSEIITAEYFVILNNNGFVWSSTNYYDLAHVDSVSFSQNGWIDYIIDTWDITISMSQDEKITIPHIYSPQKQVQNIIQAKHLYLTNKAKAEAEKTNNSQIVEENKQPTVSDEKFQILVDSLSEIVSDYIKKWVPDHDHDPSPNPF